ncbi:uncharacterized protein LOC144582801 [Callithrix jacchus]
MDKGRLSPSLREPLGNIRETVPSIRLGRGVCSISTKAHYKETQGKQVSGRAPSPAVNRQLLARRSQILLSRVSLEQNAVPGTRGALLEFTARLLKPRGAGEGSISPPRDGNWFCPGLAGSLPFRSYLSSRCLRVSSHSEDPGHGFPESCPDKPHVCWLLAGPLVLNPKGQQSYAPADGGPRRVSPGDARARGGASAGQGRGGKSSPSRPARRRGQTGHPPAAGRRLSVPAARRVPPPRAALGPVPGGQDRPQLTWAALAAGLTPGKAPASGSPRPSPTPPRRPCPRAPLTSAHCPGSLTRRWAPPPLPQAGRAAGRRGLRAAAAAAAAAATAAAAAAASPGERGCSSSSLLPAPQRRHRPRPPPRAPPLPKSGSAPRPGRSEIAPARLAARPQPALWHRAARPPAGRRPPRRGGGRAPGRGASGREPRTAGAPGAGAHPRSPPRALRAQVLLPPALGTRDLPPGPASPRRTAPAPKSSSGRGSGRRAGVPAALGLPMPPDPAGRAPGAERAPSPGHTDTHSPDTHSLPLALGAELKQMWDSPRSWKGGRDPSQSVCARGTRSGLQTLDCLC